MGRALARLGHRQAEQQNQPPPQTVERATRARILELLREASEPLTVEALCGRTALHTNTVRGHLEVLLAGNFVTRERGPAKGRGRPPWLYSAVRSQDPETLDELKDAIRADLAEADDATIAEEAAARWADIEMMSSDAQIRSNADSVAAATVALSQAGFHAAESPSGDRIEITHCPYVDFVSEHPVICEIHTALLTEVLDRAGQEVTLGRMDIWTPGTCTAHLNRNDLSPGRTITVDEVTGRKSKRKT